MANAIDFLSLIPYFVYEFEPKTQSDTLKQNKYSQNMNSISVRMRKTIICNLFYYYDDDMSLHAHQTETSNLRSY